MRLPNMSPSRARTMSLQAVALAYHATETAQSGAFLQSSMEYTKALRLHRAFVDRVLMGPRLTLSVAIKAVTSNIVLAFFEAVQCTSHNAYQAHIGAAAVLLELMGPEKCHTGMLNELYFTVRSQSVSLSCIT
jgi:hypothetical protein